MAPRRNNERLPVMALFTSYGVVNVKFLDSMLGLLASGEIQAYAHKDTIVRPRNMDTLVRHFLNSEQTWAFFTAADMEIPQGTLLELHRLAKKHAYDAITPVTYSHNNRLGYFPAFWSKYDGSNSLMGLPAEVKDEVVPIEACGCYSLLVHRRALELVYDTYGAWFVGDQERPSDHVFSERLCQVADVGVVPDLRVGHWRGMKL